MYLSAVTTLANLLASSFWSRIWEMLLTPSLQLFLLIGSALLAILLLILTLTRLGHARPVMKCVILSVIAHILLLGYAYGTKLIFEYPALAEASPMEMTLSEYEEYPVAISADEQPVDSPHIEVDRFATTSMLPEVESLQRPSMDSELVIEPVLEGKLENFGAEIHSMRGNFEPVENAPVEVTPLEVEEYDPSDIAPPQLQTPDLQPSEFDPDSVSAFEPTATAVAPEEIEVQRLGESEGEQVSAVPETSPEIPETAPMEMPPVEVAREDAESAFVDDQQRAEQFESGFVVPDADRQVVDQFLPATKEPSKGESVLKSQADTSPAAAESKPQPAQRRLRVGDGKAIPRMYSLRNEGNRQQVAQRRGGSDETERAVAAALEWLAKTQKSDGRWDPRETGGGKEQRVLGHDRDGCGANADTGITALATLTFLGSGNSHLEGKHRVVVQRALEFLVRSQTSDGSLAGDARLFARMYCHSMSLLALSEALAVTGDERLVNAVRAGVAYSANAQNSVDGGWRYQPGDRGDMSQFGWQVLALHSAAIGGIQVNQKTIDQMHRFLDLCTSGEEKGLASYRPGQGPSTTMTAEALLCRYFMKGSASAETVSEAQNRILRESPNVSQKNFYYWYYATMAMYHTGGNAWSKWNQELKETLLPMQVQGGTDHGSWQPDGMWCGYGGRVYSTAMATLCLEVYYRYLPIYEVAKAN